MANFQVLGEVKIYVTMDVEADSREEAIDMAQDQFVLRDYCGNGRSGGAIVGVNDERVTITADNCEAAFTDAEEVSP